jgi:hypothetical protein
VFTRSARLQSPYVAVVGEQEPQEERAAEERHADPVREDRAPVVARDEAELLDTKRGEGDPDVRPCSLTNSSGRTRAVKR